jgi:hypothetical protein
MKRATVGLLTIALLGLTLRAGAVEPWSIYDPGPPIITDFNEIRTVGFPTCVGSEQPRARVMVKYADEDGNYVNLSPLYSGARMFAEFTTTTGIVTKDKFLSTGFRDGGGGASGWHTLRTADGTTTFQVTGPVGSQFGETQGWVRVWTLGGPTGIYDFWFEWADVKAQCV